MPTYNITLYYTLTQEFYHVEAADEEAAILAIETSTPDHEETSKRPDDIIIEEEEIEEVLNARLARLSQAIISLRRPRE